MEFFGTILTNDYKVLLHGGQTNQLEKDEKTNKRVYKSMILSNH